MDCPGLFSPFNGDGECDMAPKERKKVGFIPDTTPPLPELHDYSSQGTSGLGDAEPVILPREGVSTLNTKNTSPSQAHPALEHDYPTPRLQRNSVSERDLARQLSMALGQPYASKPRPSIRKPAESIPSNVELSNTEEIPSSRQNSVEHRATVDVHKRASRLAARVCSYPANKPTVNSGNFTDSESSSQNIEGVVEPLPPDSTKQKKEVEESDDDVLYQRHTRRRTTDYERETQELVGNHFKADAYYDVDDTPSQSGQVTPAPEPHAEVGYIPNPKNSEVVF